ncbi:MULTISPECIES: DUF4136 domain-containing protein [unclassified Olleya]|jgi:hypothetical protein|uniref:DUF4136 domain-containing protein n=1 Tax=unclassified Olleya TaxID=2615019 RepID=UPI00119F88C0|nr:DUF4136 domain-containing protein [Olleya sp. Hel_I_94]TVZ48634.1 uncharacterized protein DUF4136 [Olleya sp. Hel_I_94]|tara:strand:- start:8577 stop:9122 length:546 start_codon:yes stop_codon:yes gene_type:complete
MNKTLRILPALLLLIAFTSCSSVKVAADYDKAVDFNNYKTFAFFKSGIDKAEINDIDKRRILRAIESELLAKGYTKSEKPDLLVSIFTKSNQRVDVYNNNWGVGAWGWGGPRWGWGWNMQPTVSTTTQGVLYVDLIDANKKELVWQGQGTGYLSKNVDKKEERIKEFVTKIMEKYPPGMEQ